LRKLRTYNKKGNEAPPSLTGSNSGHHTNIPKAYTSANIHPRPLVQEDTFTKQDFIGIIYSMDRKLRYILALSLIVALATPAFNLYYLYPKLKEIVISVSADEAVEVADHLSDFVFHENRLNLSDDIKAHMESNRRNFNLSKIKVYDTVGKTVLSTDPKDEGSFFGHDYFESRVKKGETVTNLVKAGGYSLEGELFNTDVIEVYVPIMDGDRFVGAFETYFDISGHFSEVNSMIKTSTTIVVIAMTAFFVIISALAGRINRTVSLLVKAETEAEKASRAKGDFLAHMSHEMRTPMNAILGLADILMSNGLSEHQREELSMLRYSASNLLNIINDVLDISKIEAGMLELNSDAFAVREILEDLVKSLSVMSSEKGLDLTLEISPEVPEFILGDPTRLTQIINNLLMNAIKFTEKGYIKLSVSACKTKCDGHCIEFSVTDTGIGISEENRKSIFSAFNQADSGAMRKYGGTGLGLTITAKLAEMMSGTIELESEEGVGSRFSFKACFIEPSESDISEASGQKRGQVPELLHPGTGRTLRILLAEDNIINQKVATKILNNAGHTVVVADNGKDAIERLAQDRFDLILMDIEMPVLDGYEATRIIRGLDGESSRIPILAMTAHAFERDCQRCLDMGMNNYISKPINAKSLVDIINRTARQD